MMADIADPKVLSCPFKITTGSSLKLKPSTLNSYKIAAGSSLAQICTIKSSREGERDGIDHRTQASIAKCAGNVLDSQMTSDELMSPNKKVELPGGYATADRPMVMSLLRVDGASNSSTGAGRAGLCACSRARALRLPLEAWCLCTYL